MEAAEPAADGTAVRTTRITGVVDHARRRAAAYAAAVTTTAPVC
ncbi:hypothetical protein [Micromonospora sp. NPDC049799]